MPNLNKYIGDLPDNTSLDGTELFELQKGASGTSGSSQKLTLTTLANKIGVLIASLFATAAQGAIADSAVQFIASTDTDLEVDNSIPTDPSLSLGANIARYAQAGKFTKGQSVSALSTAGASGTVTPDCAASNCFEYIVTGNITIANPINSNPGQFINIQITMDATGGYTLGLGSAFKIMNSTSFVTTANTVNILSGYISGDGNIYCNISQ